MHKITIILLMGVALLGAKCGDSDDKGQSEGTAGTGEGGKADSLGEACGRVTCRAGYECCNENRHEKLIQKHA